MQIQRSLGPRSGKNGLSPGFSEAIAILIVGGIIILLIMGWLT
ncbi:hypothetical protein [Paenibacillus camerounensis]|nr:hypothetical protein [Paenibacillus camerounensis]